MGKRQFMYYNIYCKIKEKVISDINFYVGLIDEPEQDCYGGYETIHYEQSFEGLPSDYIPLEVKQYRKNYVLAYTDNDKLIELYQGKQWKWNWLELCDWEEPYDMPETLRYAGNYIVKIPYEKIILEDLFLILNQLHDEYKCNAENDVDWEQITRLLEYGKTFYNPLKELKELPWESQLKELPDDD